MNTYCIYTAQHKPSVNGLKRCQKSAKVYGIDLIPYPSVHHTDMEAIQKKLGIKSKYTAVIGSSTYFDMRAAPRGRIANGTTHYMLYQQCVQLNEPIAILEHDAYFVAPFPKDLPENIDDAIIQISSHNVLQLTPNMMETCGRAVKMKKYGKTQKPYRDWSKESGVIPHPLSGTNGTSGYIIGPKAAQKMIDYITVDGLGFADRLREDHIGEGNLYFQVPQCVLCPNDIKSTRM